MTMQKTAEPEGGWNPEPLRATSKDHSVRAGRSLCGRWLYRKGQLEVGQDDHPENGAACRRQKAGLDQPVATAASGAGRNRGNAA